MSPEFCFKQFFSWCFNHVSNSFESLTLWLPSTIHSTNIFEGILFAKHSTPSLLPSKKKKKNQGPTVIWSCLHHYPDFHFPVLFHFYQWWGSPLCFICLLLHCTIFAYSFIPLFLELVLIFLLQTTPIQVPSNPNSYGRHILWILFLKPSQ